MNISTIDYNLFKPFIAVYETKNIARAAEKLVITPSAVGMRIKELERQLGIKFFIAHARGVHPTKEADELYALINPAISALNNVTTVIKDFDETTVGTLKIGCPSNVVTSFLADFICDFIIKYPKIKLEIRNDHRTELGEMLSKNDIDVVINKLPIPNPRGNCEVLELCDLQRSLYATKEFLGNNNLTPTLTISQLENLRLILPSKSREDTMQLLAALKKPVTSFVEIGGGNDVIFAMVLRNVGIGYVNDACVTDIYKSKIERVTVLNVDMPKHRLGVAYNKENPSKSIKVFIQALKAFCKPS